MGRIAAFMRSLYDSSQYQPSADGVEEYTPSGSRFKPYVPPQMEADFDAFLMTDVPHVNWWFTRYANWYDQEDTQEIRGEIFPINWKSKYSGSDTASNFRVSQKTEIQKGDLLIREDGEILMLIWNVEDQVNNKKSQVQVCNLMATFTRHQKAVVDPATGRLVTPEGDVAIAENIPVIAYEVANKIEYSVSYNVPGIVPNHLGTVLIQYNAQTDKIQIGDEFNWHGTGFHITDIGQGELDITGQTGMLTLTVKKAAGEERV